MSISKFVRKKKSLTTVATAPVEEVGDMVGLHMHMGFPADGLHGAPSFDAANLGRYGDAIPCNKHSTYRTQITISLVKPTAQGV